MTGSAFAGVARAGLRSALALVVAAVAFPVVALAVVYGGPLLTIPVIVALGVAGIAAITYRGGATFGVPVALSSFLAFDWYYLPPTHPLGPPSLDDITEAGLFIVMATAIGGLVTAAQKREVASEARRGLLANQQAALRRVATLVARNATPAEVFAAVAAALGGVLDADIAVVARYEVDASATMLATWQRRPGALQAPVNYSLGGRDASTKVFQSQRPVRTDYSQADSVIGIAMRDADIRCSVGVPIHVDQRLWGVAIAASRRPDAFAADVEHRMCEFTELLAMSIANAESRAELAASRARIIAAADETRRQLERDLHDGAQQRLISLALAMATAEADTPAELPKLKADLSEMRLALRSMADGLRELSRGIHPAILSEGGLEPALKGLIRRCVVPVEADIAIDGRLPKTVEVTAYYVVSEALANVAKHAKASVVTVRVRRSADTLTLQVRDDGVGGADPSRGSGLVGLEDRVKCAGGTIDVSSPPGRGTELCVALPVNWE